MQVVLLGTAAGGGVPQWNCACTQCKLARKLQKVRAQSCIAFSEDGLRWFLINAPPDLIHILAGFVPSHPEAEPLRNSPIEAVLLTNADLDHVLGLYSLREAGAITIHCTPGVRDALRCGLNLENSLGKYSVITWLAPEEEAWAPLLYRSGEMSGLSYRFCPLSLVPPLYAPDVRGVQSVAYEVKNNRTGNVALMAPDVGSFSGEFIDRMTHAKLIIFDGTFWSAEELVRVKAASRYSEEMGHIPIERGSLTFLETLSETTRVFIHINNTNPILLNDSPERMRVEQSGVIVGEDEMEFTL